MPIETWGNVLAALQAKQRGALRTQTPGRIQKVEPPILDSDDFNTPMV